MNISESRVCIESLESLSTLGYLLQSLIL